MDILGEIAKLAKTEPSEVPLIGGYLLEIDFTALSSLTTEQQSYWEINQRDQTIR